MSARLAIAVIAWLCAPRPARADYDSDWRDGCPPGNLERAADYLAYSRAHPPGAAAAPAAPYSTDANQTGPSDGFDSAIIPTRLLVLGDYAHYADGRVTVPGGDSRDIGRARLVNVLVQAHLNVPLAVDDQLRLGVTAVAPWAQRLPGDGAGSAPHQFGNIAVMTSLRFGWLSSYLHRRQGSADPEGDVAAVRHAIAIQGMVTGAPVDYDRADRLILARRSGFEGYLFTPRRSYGGSLEYRAEGVGCYSPFFHLRLSGFGTATDGRTTLLLPQTVALGLAVASDTSVFFQYGLLVTVGAQDQRPDQEPLFVSDAVHRLRVGIAWSFPRWSVTAHLDQFLGNAAYQGTLLTVYMSLHIGGHGGWQ